MHKTPLKLLSSTFSPLPPVLSLSLSPCLPCFATELAAAALPPRLPLELADAAAPRSSRTSLPPRARDPHTRRGSMARSSRVGGGVRARSPHTRRGGVARGSRTGGASELAAPTRAAAAWLAAPAQAAAWLAAPTQAAAAELVAPTRAAAAWLAALASGEGRARGWGGGGKRGSCPCSPRAREERHPRWASARNPHPRRCCCWARHGHRRHGRAEASASAAAMGGGGGGRTKGDGSTRVSYPSTTVLPRRGAWSPAPWSRHGRCRHGHAEEGS